MKPKKTFEVYFNDGSRKIFRCYNYNGLLLVLTNNKMYKNVTAIKRRE